MSVMANGANGEGLAGELPDYDEAERLSAYLRVRDEATDYLRRNEPKGSRDLAMVSLLSPMDMLKRSTVKHIAHETDYNKVGRNEQNGALWVAKLRASELIPTRLARVAYKPQAPGVIDYETTRATYEYDGTRSIGFNNFVVVRYEIDGHKTTYLGEVECGVVEEELVQRPDSFEAEAVIGNVAQFEAAFREFVRGTPLTV